MREAILLTLVLIVCRIMNKMFRLQGSTSTVTMHSVIDHLSRSSSGTAVETANTNVGMMAMRA